ncbi:SAM-dependent methyltransferase [Streptomyces griseoviridis]|uniref:Uncharacterized protein n=1 Tax=Streptomyces griseoviridis TaxID=45398 RepID=A0A918GET7_STRGD|nr:SAM-dependent methyltransferase [Streptomyces niveoruber]GGS31384.1 hypothetical protein GCM10010238_20550 [Streptomyces niveoruber]
MLHQDGGGPRDPSPLLAVCFLARAVCFQSGEAGVRQSLGIGTGPPTADNTHEVVQRVAPEGRVVYADNDSLVLARAQALPTSGPEGACACLDAGQGPGARPGRGRRTSTARSP